MEIPIFTGINSPYEEPLNPDLRSDIGKHDVNTFLDKVIKTLKTSGVIRQKRGSLRERLLFYNRYSPTGNGM